MITEEIGEVLAVVVADNRYSSEAIVELSDPPKSWRVPALYKHLRCYAKGETPVNELVPSEQLRDAWFDLTGIPLARCLNPFRERI